MVPQQRGHVLREQDIPYQTGQYNAQLDTSVNREVLDDLLKNVSLIAFHASRFPRVQGGKRLR